MVRLTPLTVMDRYDVALRALARGNSPEAAADIAGVGLRTVFRWQATGPPGNRGRVPDTALRARALHLKRIARRKVTRNGRTIPLFASAIRVAQQYARETGTRVLSIYTVRRSLASVGVRSRVRPRHPNLRQAPIRLAFARKWARRDPKLNVFSDEHFVSTNDNSLRMMFVADGEDPLPRERQRRQNVPNFQIWGAIGVGYRSPLIFFPKRSVDDDRAQPGGFRLDAAGYVRRCLSRVRLDLAGKVFMHDGARCHQAGSTRAYLARMGVEVMEGYPAHSPDCNPIESLWAILDRMIAERLPRTDEELKAAALAAWDAIPQSVIDNLVLSFQAKMKSLIRSGGI